MSTLWLLTSCNSTSQGPSKAGVETCGPRPTLPPDPTGMGPEHSRAPRGRARRRGVPYHDHPCPGSCRGLQPSGDLHLGNYLGAVRNWVADHQHAHDAFYCVVDLHALTLDTTPSSWHPDLRAATDLLAIGLDPRRLHPVRPEPRPRAPRLAWLLECTATIGELRRMTQFKDKGGQDSVRVGLFTYPVLQAADILLYDAERVPSATTSASTSSSPGTWPTASTTVTATPWSSPRRRPDRGRPGHGPPGPDRKMSKSVSSPLGTILVLDPRPRSTARCARR
jgi:tryptophanyl-tRNA synthetase